MKISRTKKTKAYIPKTEEEKEQVRIKEFLDMCAPSVLKFYPDYYICGSSFRSTWVVREYPTDTEEQALLRHLGDRSGVTLRVYTRHVTPAEERKIISNAASRNRMNRSSGNIQKEIIAESNLNDVMNLIAQMHRDREPLVHCAVFIEISTPTLEKLKEMQAEVEAELTRSKISVDKLFLRQKEGFESTQPCGNNAFHEQFERVIPATSAANLYPFNYSGKADPQGFYIGHDKYGSNLFIDFQRRTDDKTNANILILGNSGQGKSYLMKLLLCNMRESGMDIVCLDPELEYKDLAVNMDGCYIDLMEGEYIINVLEPKRWEEDSGSVLPRHISFLRDFFRAYKDFTSAEIDVLEIFLEKLYALIDAHLSDPDLSVEELGEQIGLSRVQLYRKTKALCGYAPNELLRIARLKRAASLLAGTEKTIAEITYEVGFSSPSYFTKCYKEYFGENPTEFLKRKNGNQKN